MTILRPQKELYTVDIQRINEKGFDCQDAANPKPEVQHRLE